MSGHRDELAGIHVQSGIREDEGDGLYRGFCTVFATASDGFRMIGQLDPEEVRKMALNFLGAAESATQDAVVMNIMVRDMEAEPGLAAAFVTGMRNERRRIDPDPDGDDEDDEA